MSTADHTQKPAEGVPAPKEEPWTAETEKAKETTTAAGAGAPAAGSVLDAGAATGTWSTGLCECGEDIGGCVDAFLCARCVLSQQYVLHEDPTRDPASIYWPFVGVLLAPELLVAVCCGVPADFLTFPAAVYLRIRTRERYGIVNQPDQPRAVNALIDCLALSFCTPCAIAQQHREIALRGDRIGKVLFGRPAAEVEHPPVADMV